MPVASGEMRDRLTLHAPAGEYAVAAADLATGIPARIIASPLQFQQQERLAIGGPNVQTLYEIVIRYRADVQTNYQLIEETGLQRNFNILQVIPDEKLVNLSLTCVVGER